MAWEWVAPLSAAGGASIGAITTYLTGRGGREHAEQLALANARDARERAREERFQRRYSEAYVEILVIVETMYQWSALIRPFVDTNPPAALPVKLPTLAEQAKVQALALAYGSPSVRALLDDFYSAIRGLLRQDNLLHIAQDAWEQGE